MFRGGYNVGSNGGVWFPPPRYQEFLEAATEPLLPQPPPPQYQDFLYEAALEVAHFPQPLQHNHDVTNVGSPPSYLESIPLEMQLEMVSDILIELFGIGGLDMFGTGPVILFGNLVDNLKASLSLPLDPNHLGVEMVQEFLDE